MGLDLAIGIARSGLAATQRAMAQASQNIANAQTEGYTRKRIDAQAQDAGGQPQGVRSPAARRDVDLALLAERWAYRPQMLAIGAIRAEVAAVCGAAAEKGPSRTLICPFESQTIAVASKL